MAYTLLYKQFYVPMVLFASQYINNEEASKDVVQEFFISMLGQKKDFENVTALKVYLYHSVKNRCMNYIQHEQVKGRYEAFVLREFDDVDLFWDRVLEEDIYARVLEVVQELHRQYRNVMMLWSDGCSWVVAMGDLLMAKVRPRGFDELREEGVDGGSRVA